MEEHLDPSGRFHNYGLHALTNKTGGSGTNEHLGLHLHGSGSMNSQHAHNETIRHTRHRPIGVLGSTLN